jgi:hypothetical protein
MVLHRESQIGATHRPPLFFEISEAVMRVQLVQHVAVDVEEVAAVGALAYKMKVPDLVEQSLRHGVSLSDGVSFARIIFAILGGPKA